MTSVRVGTLAARTAVVLVDRAVVLTGAGDRAFCAGADLSAGSGAFEYVYSTVGIPVVTLLYSGRPVAEVFHGVFPHFIAHLFAIAILVIWPQIILWLPVKMGY